MEFRHLRAFETIAQLMSFNRAAQVLHCTQSTISAQIKALEQDLGVPVFERLGRRIALTAAGEELQHHTRRLFEYEKEIYSTVRGRRDPAGVLSLRVPQSISEVYLPAILAAFNQDYPSVGFDVWNCGYHRLADELRSGMTDAAFLLANHVDFPDLHVTRLGTEPLVFVSGPSSKLAGRSSLTFKDLDGSTVLLPKHDCGYRMRFEGSLRAARVRPASIFELNSLSSVVSCLAQGIGVALLPLIAVRRELSERRLVALDWQTPLQSGLLLLRHRDRSLQGAFGAFIAAVERYFASSQSDVGPGRPWAGQRMSKKSASRRKRLRGSKAGAKTRHCAQFGDSNGTVREPRKPLRG